MPDFIKKYIEYIKDNPEGYWFKRKAFGWGWVPATREGWLIMLFYVIALVLLAINIDETATAKEWILPFFLPYILLTLALVIIVYRNGEKPKWMWGIPRNEQKNDQERNLQ